MKSLTEHLWFEVPGRRGFVNITDTVAKLVQRSGVQEGLCLVNAMHITASVFINDAEDGLLHDYDAWLEQLAPHAPAYESQVHFRRHTEHRIFPICRARWSPHGCGAWSPANGRQWEREILSQRTVV